MTTWRKILENVMRHYGESFEDVIATTLTPEQLIEAFDNGYGGIEGCSFTLWTKNRVYFPTEYDGAEWAASVPRNPSEEVTRHI